MVGPQSSETGTPPRQMTSCQHARRAAAHEAAADGDFSVQVSNARTAVAGSAAPEQAAVEEAADDLWGSMQLTLDETDSLDGAAAAE